VNLALARLAARRRDIPQAIRYYHGAIYGEWDRDPIQHRNQAQLELVNFLLHNDAAAEAQSELLALSQEAPNDPGLHMEIAGLFAQAGDYEDALEENRRVLALEPRNSAAMSGAGIAAFEQGNYAPAEEYLRKAVERDPSNQRARSFLETLNLMKTWNPYERGLNSAERRRRVMQAFTQAGARLESCAAIRGEKLAVEQPASELQKLDGQWTDLSPGMNERMLRMQPDLADSAMDVVFRIEERTKALCGAPTGADEALLLIGEDRQGGGH
jgi:tetratricopeptide (TPR) repeat protein